MQCPRCTDYELKTVKSDDIEVDQCPNCLGIWFDVSEMTALVEKQNLDGIKLSGKPGGMRTIVPLNCPRDGTLMDMVNDVKAADIQMDVCPTCGGRWLDGGELDRLREKGLLANLKNFFVTYILPD
ncbi:MAG: zf-TFIIB domain-containing protein [Aphanocapsa lilacina HA4352-LM1]|jgi:Zn-finger nucleic acid-binding protein|nr:zf-TFIIB domain-containing protein [Aphanocapsa lilacina HA4352-LM1]